MVPNDANCTNIMSGQYPISAALQPRHSPTTHHESRYGISISRKSLATCT